MFSDIYKFTACINYLSEVSFGSPVESRCVTISRLNPIEYHVCLGESIAGFSTSGYFPMLTPPILYLA